MTPYLRLKAFLVRLLGLCLLLTAGSVSATDISLDEAIDMAVNKSSRGSIIDGNLEVAEQQYFAEKINFYLPEISINGALPSYNVTKDFGFFQGTATKGERETTRLSFNSDITLNQNLITGGDLEFRAVLTRRDLEESLQNGRSEDEWEFGTFDFALKQPLLQPSQARHDFHNSRDDLDLARLKRQADLAELKSEVIDAFFGVLQAELTSEVKHSAFESARLQAEIDSIKNTDEILSEDDLLESQSKKLDAELEHFDAINSLSDQRKTLATLLEQNEATKFSPKLPAVPSQLDTALLERYVAAWETSAPIMTAKSEYKKQERAAKFAGGGHGLTGTLEVTYGLDRGRYEDINNPDFSRDLDNDRWGVSLNFSYPLWDGGASSASVKASRLASEQARVEYEAALRTARAEIENLANKLKVSHRKLSVLQRQVDLTKNREKIARSRMDDGQISMLTFLESKVTHLEAQDRYYQEMKDFFKTRVELEGKYPAN